MAMAAVVRELFVLLIGAILGVALAQPWTDRVVPMINKPSAKVSSVTVPPVGREAIISVETGSVLPEHEMYLVVESDGRYWPQSSLEPFSSGTYGVVLGAVGKGDIGRTFVVMVVDASGPAKSRILDYFNRFEETKVRQFGIDFRRVENKIKRLDFILLKRDR